MGRPDGLLAHQHGARLRKGDQRRHDSPHGPAAPTEGQAVNAYACTIQIPAIDEYVAKVVAAGGTIALPKMPIPGIGWLAYFKDTEGNIVGIMQPDPQAK